MSESEDYQTLEVPLNSLIRVLQLASSQMEDEADLEHCREVAKMLEKIEKKSPEDMTSPEFIEWAWKYRERPVSNPESENLDTAKKLIEKFMEDKKQGKQSL